MRFYVRLDGAASAKSLSISDNATVGEVREALKCNGLEWLLDDGAYAQAADSRSISGLIADGLHATGQSAAEAVHLRSISQVPASPQQGLLPKTPSPVIAAAGSIPANGKQQPLGPIGQHGKGKEMLPAMQQPTKPSAIAAVNSTSSSAQGNNSKDTGQQQSKAAVQQNSPGDASATTLAAARPNGKGPEQKNHKGTIQQSGSAAASVGKAAVTPGSAAAAAPLQLMPRGPSSQPTAATAAAQKQQLPPAHGVNNSSAKTGTQAARAASQGKASQGTAIQATASQGADSQGTASQGTAAAPVLRYLNSHHGQAKLERTLSPSAAALALSAQAKQADTLPKSRLAAAALELTPASKQPTAAVPGTANRPVAATTAAAAPVKEVKQSPAAPSIAAQPGAATTAAAASAKEVKQGPAVAVPAAASFKEAKQSPAAEVPGVAAATNSDSGLANSKALTGAKLSSAAACRGCGKAEFPGCTVTASGSRWHQECWKCTACSAPIDGPYNTGQADNLPYHPACFQEKFGKRCAACSQVLSGSYTTVDGQPLHNDCFKCTACQGVIGDKYTTHKELKTHFHPACYKEKYGVRCSVCGKLDTDITVGAKAMHRQCFKCAACSKVISGNYRDDEAKQAFYHPDCYQEKFGARCTACNNVFSGKYTVVEGRKMHYECFKCTACSKVIEGKYCSDDAKQAFYHSDCHREKFGARCTACNKTFSGKYTVVEGKNLHYECFKCTACSKIIEGKYRSDDAKQAFYHPECYQEKFGARCAACNKLLDGPYIVVNGKNLHNDCFKCTECHLPIGGAKYHTHGDDKLPYHSACHRKNFDPRCDVCDELIPLDADGHVEYLVSSFWKQKFCKKHSTDGTLRCCSCNRLKPKGQQWLALSIGRRSICHDCSCTAVRSTAEAQPLYDNVLRFFGQMGLSLRERYPMMLVDGDTLDKQRHGSKHADEQAPVFHTLGLCMKQGCGDVQHVVYSQPGFSSLYKQPSLNATLRPADLSQVEWKVKGLLVMYGLPWLLTGAILAHEVMHAWVAENNINCGRSDGDELSAVGEGLAELLGFMWLEAQVSPIAAVKAAEGGQVPLPQAKPVPQTWAQRVAANGRPYFQDPVTRQITWNDPNRWQEVLAPDGCTVYLDMQTSTALSTASRHPAVQPAPVITLTNLMSDWREHVTEGKKFYYNSRTKESVWTLPAEVQQQVTWFERLSSYHGHQTRTNQDTVYGDGFRAALEAFQQHGLRNVLLHVKKTHFLPSADNGNDNQSKQSIKNAFRRT